MLLKQSGQSGASLIEVMVALFVMAIGLLGFAALLTTSSTLNQRAFQLSQAVFLAESIVERVRANRNGSSVSDYGVNLSENPSSNSNCDSSACSPTDMAKWDVAQWMMQVNSLLPSGDAQIEVNTVSGITSITVTVYYELREGGKSTGGAGLLGKLESYVLRTEI